MIHELTPLDNAFLLLEVPGSAMNIGAVIKLETGHRTDSTARFELLRNTVAERLHELPVFTQRVVRAPLDLAWPFLVADAEFDIARHVIRCSLPEPGSGEQLDELIAEFWSRPLLRDRPLWQMIVVDGLADGHTVVALKVHHSLADGVSGAETFARLFDVTPEIRVPEPCTLSPESVATTTPRFFVEGCAELARHPTRLVKKVVSWLLRIWSVGVMVANSIVLRRRRVNPSRPSIFEARRTSFCGTPGQEKAFRSLLVPLDDAKRAAKSRGATVTDFVTAVVSGALRRLMEDRGEVLEKDLVAFVPINVRGDGPTAVLGNRISCKLVPLHADVANPEKRLAAIARDSANTASIPRPSGDRMLQRTAHLLGPTFLAVGARVASRFGLFNVAPPIANVMISSLPGSPISLWLSGLSVQSIAPVGPLLGAFALNITALGYCDNLEFGLLGATNRVPDVGLLRDYLLAEANMLIDATAS